MQNLISIVMPVKNAALYLAQCLDSILAQSEKNWELIAVNDHSADDSLEMLNIYASQDTRITVLPNHGDGIIPALQTAYAACTGTMIHRMDADDVMPENKLKWLSAKLSEFGKGHVVTGLVHYFAAGGVSAGFKNYEQWLNALCSNDTHWDAIYKECVVASPAWLIYREDFEACGGFQSEIYPEDYDLVFRFYRAGFKIKSVNKVVHLWRDHSERTSRNHPNYKENDFFAIKLRYFFQLDREPDRPLVVWGAGIKGKTMAKLLKAQRKEFVWASDNPNKHGHNIYEQIMKSIEQIMQLENPQILITVAQRNAQSEIRRFMSDHELSEYKDYHFFR